MASDSDTSSTSMVDPTGGELPDEALDDVAGGQPENNMVINSIIRPVIQ
jgi:hypothetical protein